ncbi:spore coat protein [Bacillus licheniformis]|uniref:DegT/DnrJ/EryC1/StrS family aminotransferase n=1 Tax=Bacillus licheniformis TaxID=1402 RepID=UPI000BA7B0AA|nr:DegT/DnrJ/EryC1/StrS family aminotransferase [Bacillus licheniformis]PAC90601.1 spore coat protein [Bacillus licheniformis]
MIRLIEPYITFEEVQAELKEIFSSGMLTKGPYVRTFADHMRQYVSTKHAFLTTSATTALSMCLKSLNVQPGDEVIVSDFSFPATVNVIEDLGAKPVFADVDLETFNMLPEELESQITSRTKAVLFVDALGNPTGITNIKQICKEYGLPLVDDAACAIGSSEYGCKSGKIADLTCFSFHPRKLLTTGEGGAITTDREELKDWLSVKLNHGAAISDGKLDFIDFGYNYRLSDIQAALGIKQLQKLDDIIHRRNLQQKAYSEQLEPLGFQSQQIGPNVVHNIQSAVFKVPKNIVRDELIQYLSDCHIESTFGTYCLSGTTYYRRKYRQIKPNSIFLEQNTITLPCHDQVNVDQVVSAIQSFSQRKG